MKSRTRTGLRRAGLVIGALALAALPAAAQAEWKPTRNIEFIVPAGTGGGADQMARMIQGVIEKNNLIDKSVEALKTEFSKVRTGRAHTGLLDHLHVDYYGAHVPIPQVANVTLLDARTIAVQPWEKKMVQVVEKAIRDSDLGVNPATSGDLIRVPMPALTEERRRELVRVVHKEAEAARVAVRNIRRDANEQLKKLLKNHEVPEDEERRAQDEVQKLTDRTVAEIDKLVHAKEAEVLAV